MILVGYIFYSGCERKEGFLIKKKLVISRNITVGLQPSEEEFEELRARGVKTIVNLATKGELGQKMKLAEEAELAKEAGLHYVHLPISLSRIKESEISEFCEVLENSPRPIYVHCRIGQRSVPLSLIYHGLKQKLSPSKTLARAKKLGITWSAPMLKSLVENSIEKMSAVTCEEPG